MVPSTQNILFGRICARCGNTKPADEFPRRMKKGQWVLRTYCFKCQGHGDGTKTCSTCKKIIPLSQFPSKGKSGLVNNCFKCYRPKKRSSRKSKSITILDFIRNYKKTHSCVDCGISDWRVLDFDHVRGIKRFAISSKMNGQASIKTIKEEIAKCDMRCANCHRIRHFEEKK